MAEKKSLGTFEKYLPVWVILCIILGIRTQSLFPRKLFQGKSFRVYPTEKALPFPRNVWNAKRSIVATEKRFAFFLAS